MLLLGLWFGKSKPDFNVYMVPIAKRLKKLYLEGFHCLLFLLFILNIPVQFLILIF